MREAMMILSTVLFMSVFVTAQVTTGEIRGVVVDPTGSIVGAASVTVRNVDSNAVRNSATDEEGRFHVPQLPVGTYTIAVEKAGFARYSQGPIVLRLNQIADLRIPIVVADVSQDVNVIADAALINSTNAEVGVNFEHKRISELPLAPNRSVVNLALSAPGVTQMQGGQSGLALGPEGSVAISVNGMRVRSNNFVIDGQDSNFHVLSGLAQRINNPDIVAEFRLITNQFAPEYGKAGGSIVNIITRSGTNRFHGSAFVFHNDNHLNSRSNLDKLLVESAPFRIENQFGGTLGGPIVPDKTFFFGSLQRWTDRRFVSGRSIRVPTAEGRALLSALGGDRPTVQALLEHLPLAQSAVTGSSAPLMVGGQRFSVPLGTLSGASNVSFNDWQWSARVDHRLSEAHNFGGRYLYDQSLNSGDGQITPTGLTTILRQRRQAATLFLNSTLSPATFNEVRVSYQRFMTAARGSNPAAERIPSIEVTELGLSGTADGAARSGIGLAVSLPRGSRNNTYQLQDTFSLVRGSHVMKFGGDFRREETAVLNIQLSRGRLLYNTLQDFFDDVAAVGRINSPLPGGASIYPHNYHDYAAFFQDEWRVRPDLTLTYGVRYESPSNMLERLISLNQRIVGAAGRDARYVFGPIPPRDRNNWAPRFGFNYRLGGKAVLRGGYARTYDQFFQQLFTHAITAFPFVKSDSLPARSPNSMTALLQLPSSTVATNPDLLDHGIVSADLRAPLAEQVSLQIQHELHKDWALSIGYVGTKGTALFETIDGNPVVPGSNPRRRVDPARGVVTVRCNCTSSTYHSLQTSLEKRLSQNFSMAAHYTWSSFIDGASDVMNPTPTGETGIAQDAFNRRAERGRSAFDRPHRFVTNGVFELPFYRSQNNALSRVLGGWQLSAFLTLQSGAPFSALAGADPGGRVTPLGTTVRAIVNTTLDLAGMSIEEILRAGGASLFAPVTAANSIGNMGRNVLRSAPYRNMDLGILKNTKLGETHNLQLRAEFYNLTNTRNFGVPDGTITSSNFLNQWGTDGGNRRIVVGMRYFF
jgi:hypothetical protein